MGSARSARSRGSCAECTRGAYIDALSCERTCLGSLVVPLLGEHGTEGAEVAIASPQYQDAFPDYRYRHQEVRNISNRRPWPTG